MARNRSLTAAAEQARARRAFVAASRCVEEARAWKEFGKSERVTVWAAMARTYTHLGLSYRRSAAHVRRRAREG